MAGISPEMRHMMRPARSSPETEQARRVLAWLDGWLPQWLAAQDRREAIDNYLKARQAQGAPAQGDAQIRGGPRIHGMKVDVVGTPDEMYGHHRLNAIVADVIMPLVESGAMDRGRARDLQQRLRGYFATGYGQIEQALAKAPRLSADERQAAT